MDGDCGGSAGTGTRVGAGAATGEEDAGPRNDNTPKRRHNWGNVWSTVDPVALWRGGVAPGAYSVEIRRGMLLTWSVL